MFNAYGITLPGLPIQLHCFQDGTISFHKLGLFKAVVDLPEPGVQAIIDEDGINIGCDTELVYNERYVYQDMPELFSWLVAQRLEMPVFAPS